MGKQPSPVASAAPAFNRTDAGNGEYFARLYGDRLRYDHRRGRWLVWDGHWWREDDTRSVRRLAKQVARSRYGRATSIDDLPDRAAEATFAIGSENRERLEATLLAAQTEPPVADPGDPWDADPWLLGVGNGVVDLRTGTLRPGIPEDVILARWEAFTDDRAARIDG